MNSLWDKEQEKTFFLDARRFAEPEQLFYLGDDNKYRAYWPKNYEGEKSTLQARNALIGNFTEKWSVDLLCEFANSKGLFVVQGAVCDELGLPERSPADVAICRTKNKYQQAKDICIILEVKMSVVWNWELNIKGAIEELICLGDYKTHRGTPGLLRSDSMLKAIGKSINIRVSSPLSSKIPIVILGNTPIMKSYYHKVDFLEKSGIIQGFWSINPKPCDYLDDDIKKTPGEGFYRIDTYEELVSKLGILLTKEFEFFSSMKPKNELGKIIEIANQEPTYDKKAEKFLALIRK
jgi:hypothetical protein